LNTKGAGDASTKLGEEEGRTGATEGVGMAAAGRGGGSTDEDDAGMSAAEGRGPTDEEDVGAAEGRGSTSHTTGMVASDRKCVGGGVNGGEGPSAAGRTSEGGATDGGGMAAVGEGRDRGETGVVAAASAEAYTPRTVSSNWTMIMSNCIQDHIFNLVGQ
jgi:hypothetical protein